jgi:hypothetical protein
MGALAQPHHDFLRRDRDAARGIDELPEHLARAGLSEPFQTLGQTAIQQIRYNRQGEIEVHVQPHIAAQAIQMEERDLFSQPVLDVIPAGVGLDDLPSGLTLRAIVGQEKVGDSCPRPVTIS